jgi:hypothetical protein
VLQVSDRVLIFRVLTLEAASEAREREREKRNKERSGNTRMGVGKIV